MSDCHLLWHPCLFLYQRSSFKDCAVCWAGVTSSEQLFPLRFGCHASVHGAYGTLSHVGSFFCPSRLHNEKVARDLTLG